MWSRVLGPEGNEFELIVVTNFFEELKQVVPN